MESFIKAVEQNGSGSPLETEISEDQQGQNKKGIFLVLQIREIMRYVMQL
jgi:hypothetical protein